MCIMLGSSFQNFEQMYASQFLPVSEDNNGDSSLETASALSIRRLGDPMSFVNNYGRKIHLPHLIGDEPNQNSCPAGVTCLILRNPVKHMIYLFLAMYFRF